MSSNSSTGPIPKHWMHCPRKGDFLIENRFLVFKTPLSEAYTSQVPIESTFLPQMLFGYCKTLKLKLGLWIDLTNATRFYDSSVVEANGGTYVKLECRGHREIPSREQVESFIDTVKRFSRERPYDIIGVHSTHGFNRTGFLMVSYLVEYLGFSLPEALSLFARVRSPGIYKQDYIDELYKRYGLGKPATLAPELPAWCLEYDDSVNSKCGVKRRRHDESDKENYNGTTENRQPRKRRRRVMNVVNATFMEGVPGVVCVQDEPRLSALRKKVQNICGWREGGFPGCQPVSIDRDNIQNLSKIPYRVSWKPDGTRYMMLINKRDEIYFFDRNFSCFEVKGISFVKWFNLNEHLEDTLIDGQMVLDKYNGQTIPRYLIHDVIRICNYDIGKKPFFPDRLNCIKKEIVEPRTRAIEKGIIDRLSEPFGIRCKDFFDISQSASLLGEKFTKSLSHDQDGLIFQPSDEPFAPGVCSNVLKWKPHNLNSIDFRMKIDTEEDTGILKGKVCLLFVGGYLLPYARMNYTRALQEFENKIIECKVNDMGQWEFMRGRKDKTLPNSYRTAESIKRSIRQPVTKELLIDYIAKCGFRDDNDFIHMMPRPQPPPPPRTLQHH